MRITASACSGSILAVELQPSSNALEVVSEYNLSYAGVGESTVRVEEGGRYNWGSWFVETSILFFSAFPTRGDAGSRLWEFASQAVVVIRAM